MSKIRIVYVEMLTANKAVKTFDNVNAASKWLEHNQTIMLVDAKEVNQ